MNPVVDIYTGACNGIREVWSNKVRTLLSMSGIVLGVAALVTMVGIVQGMLGNMRASFELRGGILKLDVRPADPPESQQYIAGISPGLSWRDVGAIERAIPLVDSMSPSVDIGWVRFSYGGERSRAGLYGVTPEFLDIEKREIAHGRFISDADIEAKSAVIVLGTYLVERLFGDREVVVGERIQVAGQVYTVIGQFEHLEAMVGGRNSLRWQNRKNYIPVTTAIARYQGTDKVNRIYVKAGVVEELDALQEQLENTLTLTHRGIADFEIQNQQEQLMEMKKLENSFVYSMGGIAAISLLVGGIGIMNVMLASVSERIREIGVRKAIGARSHDVFLQFLAESVVISVLGGLLGLVASVGFLSIARGQIPDGDAITLFPVAAMVFGFVFSSGVGMLAGIYPALRASRLDPIEALRHE